MRSRCVGMLGLCLLAAPVVPLVWTRCTSPPLPPATAGIPSTPTRTPFDEALREACVWQGQARRAVIEEWERLEAWDSEATMWVDRETWRRCAMARDGAGYLRRARLCSVRAAALARGPEEALRAALVRVRIECDAGNHDEELRQARRVMALGPEDRQSLLVLRHAAGCSGESELQQRAADRLARAGKVP